MQFLSFIMFGFAIKVVLCSYSNILVCFFRNLPLKFLLRTIVMLILNLGLAKSEISNFPAMNWRYHRLSKTYDFYWFYAFFHMGITMDNSRIVGILFSYLSIVKLLILPWLILSQLPLKIFVISGKVNFGFFYTVYGDWV